MLLLLFVTTFALNALHAHAVAPLVNVNYTSYLGSALSDGITEWVGMRYAAPPLGNLRFAAPADPIANSTTQVANKVRMNPYCRSPGRSRTDHFLSARTYLSCYTWPSQFHYQLRRLSLHRCLCANQRHKPACILLHPGWSVFVIFRAMKTILTMTV